MSNHSPISTLIVDDETSARQSLKAFVAKYCPEITVVGEASNIDQADELIRSLHPELLFLDIEMPGGNAFDLLERYSQPSFHVIFITAYSEHAVRAFELSAADYLLKPVSIDGLVQAVQKVATRRQDQLESMQHRVLLNNMNQANKQTQKIVLPLIDGFELAALNEITHLTAFDNFTKVHTIANRTITVCRKLKYFEQLLAELGFLRIHRSHMVNRSFIKRYHKGKGGYVVLDNDTELGVSQSRKKDFLESYGM